MYEKTFPHKRYNITLDFLKKHVPENSNILDLGTVNPFSEIMKKEGYNVINTTGEDIDTNQKAIEEKEYDVLTAFEIFEHLLNPYTVLQKIKSDKIIISVPMRLWFSPAYRSKTDMWDRHYHEFEDWQLDWLLEKTGWIIKDKKKWTNPTKKIGIRPFLRLITPRYYIVYAEKKS
ncbi:class I SAM-dependent methyltransferase [Flavobacterium alkalisoli]|uniref:Class I SAM-dependent methyltransferase n=1 Tax=Flavobacterium alkalisoli TaxID=2602769 RepID=A0A5B9FQU4_9FLAO|nr:class I SAM-dependent methyltransferase [Flavobacterium alkalisoli]QEE49350.1 class I SAM-dependent methyltransferase [Flavobacterium alkalisoli]